MHVLHQQAFAFGYHSFTNCMEQFQQWQLQKRLLTQTRNCFSEKVYFTGADNLMRCVVLRFPGPALYKYIKLKPSSLSSFSRKALSTQSSPRSCLSIFSFLTGICCLLKYFESFLIWSFCFAFLLCHKKRKTYFTKSFFQTSPFSAAFFLQKETKRSPGRQQNCLST